MLREMMVDNGKPVGTLDTWFRRDDNCVPPVYVLQPISSKLPYFSRQDEPDKMKEHQGEWWETFELLQDQLRVAANEAERRGLLSPDQAKKYRISGLLVWHSKSALTKPNCKHKKSNRLSDRELSV